MERQFHPDDWADVIVGVIEGRLQIVRKSTSNAFNFSNVHVEQAELDSLLQSLPERTLPEATILPCTVAGLLLGVPSAVVGGAIKNGLLHGEHRDRKAALIPLGELTRFSQRYMMGAEGRKRIGKELRFSRQMRGAGFTPVAVLKSHCIWDRGEAEQFLANRGDKSFCHYREKPRQVRHGADCAILST